MRGPLAAAQRYAELGLSLQWLCGPECDGSAHGRSGHAPKMGGKVPVTAGWQRLGCRSFDELRLAYRPGYNLSVLTGLQPGAALSVVVVDLDGPEALAWAASSLPPTPLRTLTGREGGEHWYYRTESEVRPLDLRTTSLALPIQVLGNGRQAVAPSSAHRAGRTYAEADPWTPEAAAALPTYDPAWFNAAKRATVKAAAQPMVGAGPTTWPTEREFSERDFREAAERAVAYLASPRTPVSVSGQGGDDVLYRTALVTLRGFPLCSETRARALWSGGGDRTEDRPADSVAGTTDCCVVDPHGPPRPLGGPGPGEGAVGGRTARVEAADAFEEALRLILEVWNPRCLDEDGETPYPWDEARVAYKLSEASKASRLPGPDYWAFDDPEARQRYAERLGLPLPMIGRETGTTTNAPTISMPPDGLFQPQEALIAEQSGLSAAVGAGGSPETPPLDSGLDVAAAPPPKGAFRGESGGDWGDGDGLADASPGAVRVEVDHDTERMKDLAIRALRGMEGIYVRQHALVDVVADSGVDLHGQPRRPWVRKTVKPYLKSRMNSEVEWVRRVADGVEVRERADSETVSAVLAAGNWPGVPQLEGIAYTPVVRPDGSILPEAGYDPRTRLIYVPEVDHGEVSADPSRTQAERARDYLLGTIADFPFENDDVGRAVWLAAVLTRFCRYSYVGMSPMFMVSAKESNSGKTLLSNCASIISDGRPVDLLPFVADDAAEAKREIIALLGRDETHHICLDNIPRGTPLASAAYEAMLTGHASVGREVGTSDVKRIIMTGAVWWATGSYLEVGQDMSRRGLLIPIFDRTGKPAHRAVQNPDLPRWCRENRGRLVRAALTVLAGFAAAGGPRASHDRDGVEVREFSSFEPWSAVVRQAVIWSGLPDPCRAVASSDEQGAPEAARSGHLIQHWLAAFGYEAVQTSEACRRLAQNPVKYASMANWLADHGLARATPVGLGKFLSTTARGVYTTPDGKKYLLRRQEVSRGVLWGVKEVS